MNDWTLYFIQAILDGIATGSVYALIALGYTLVYGIIKLINFAHGEFYMAGAYAGFFVLSIPAAQSPSGWVFAAFLAVALLASSGGASLLAVLTEKIAYKPIRHADRLIALLTAIGVSFFLQNLARLAFSPDPRGYASLAREPDSAMRGFLDWYQMYWFPSIGPIELEIQNAKLVIVLATAAAMPLLYWLVMRTRFGRAMRATSQDLEAAKLMGIPTDRVVSRSFALGGAFAGLAGMLVGMLFTVDPMMGFLPGLKAFVAAVVGGIGSIPGAVLGGLAIGLAENLAVFFNLDTAYKDAVAFALLVLILLFRPNGLLGHMRREKV